MDVEFPTRFAFLFSTFFPRFSFIGSSDFCPFWPGFFFSFFFFFFFSVFPPFFVALSLCRFVVFCRFVVLTLLPAIFLYCFLARAPFLSLPVVVWT